MLNEGKCSNESIRWLDPNYLMRRICMRAVVLSEFGEPDVLKERVVRDPVPFGSWVLLKVHACGVCGHDLLGRSGAVGGYNTPIILGHEFAGEVIGIGEDVHDLSVGDRVASRQRVSCGTCSNCTNGRDTICRSYSEYGETIAGGYAELCLAHESSLAPVPEGVRWEYAAVAACGVGTTVHALKRAEVRSGETVLVTGAGGGLGVNALQVVRAAGCQAVAVTTSPHKAERLGELADAVVVHKRQEEYHVQVRALGLDPDVVVDLTAGVSLDQSLRAVRRGGRVVIVGNVDPSPTVVLPGAIIVRELDIVGSNSASMSDLTESLGLISSGRVRPVISDVFDLSDAAAAHRLAEGHLSLGRVVLQPHSTA